MNLHFENAHIIILSVAVLFAAIGFCAQAIKEMFK